MSASPQPAAAPQRSPRTRATVVAALVLVVLGLQIGFGVRLIWRKLHVAPDAPVAPGQSALTGEAAVRIAADGRVLLNGVVVGEAGDRALPELTTRLDHLRVIRSLPPNQVRLTLLPENGVSEMRIGELICALRQAGFSNMDLRPAAR